jgi:hypothetical protein
MNKVLDVCIIVGVAGCFLAFIAFKSIGPEGGFAPPPMSRSEISGLSNAVASFKSAFDVTHVPSRIKLSETCNYPERDKPNTLDGDSVRYLQKLWPRIDLTAGTEVDWNGDGQIKGDWVLEGDECLIFFLGGIPAHGDKANGCLGFAKGGRNPASPLVPRDGPFFDMKSSRLRDLHGRGFFSYLDPWDKQPYAYFSAYGQADGYNRYGGTDCPTLNVSPYADALTPKPRYLNPRGFQIVSAGKDGKFGPGGIWDPAKGAPSGPGADDCSNFSRRRLGEPQLAH